MFRVNQLEELMSQQKESLQLLKKSLSDALLNFEGNGLTVVQRDGKVYGILLTDSEIDEIISDVPQNVKDDIDFACQQVYTFAKAQRDSIEEFHTKNNGVWVCNHYRKLGYWFNDVNNIYFLHPNLSFFSFFYCLI